MVGGSRRRLFLFESDKRRCGSSAAGTAAWVRHVTRLVGETATAVCATGPSVELASKGSSNVLWKTIGVLSGVMIAGGVLAAGLIGLSPTHDPDLPAPSAAWAGDPPAVNDVVRVVSATKARRGCA